MATGPGNVNIATGVALRVKADDKAFKDALARLQKKGGDALVQAALKNLGEVLLNATRKRFDNETGPDGKKWVPLNPAYLGVAADRDKKGRVVTRGVKKGTKILQASGQLFGSLRYQVGSGVLEVGTNKIYAAAHQFGATIVPRHGDVLIFWLGGLLYKVKKVTIPARPFLGLSASDRKDGLEAIEEVYSDAWGKTP